MLICFDRKKIIVFPKKEMLIICDHFDSNVGKKLNVFKKCQGGFGYIH